MFFYVDLILKSGS